MCPALASGHYATGSHPFVSIMSLVALQAKMVVDYKWWMIVNNFISMVNDGEFPQKLIG